MTLFQAWHLPSGFSVSPGEVDAVEEAGIPTFQYPAFSTARLKELTRFLREEREKTLVSFPVGRVVDAVDRVARRFLDPADILRIDALEALGSISDFSAPMAEAVLDGMALGWQKEGLWDLVRSEFPDPKVLDGFSRNRMGDQTRAMGFPLTFHLGAGTVPGVAVTSLIRALLVKSASLLKPGLGDLPLPVAFSRGIREEDPELARSLAVVYWPGEEKARTETVLKDADLVVAYGSDETVQWVRRHLPPQTPLRAYRHRMGFVLLGRDAFLREEAPGGGGAWSVARAAARSTSLFDQKGCVSPHVFLVEEGGEVGPEEWAALLARAFEEMEPVLPSGRISLEDGVTLQQLRGVAELEEGYGRGVVHHGGEESPWTVLYVPGGNIEPSCLNRTVRILPVEALSDALERLRDWTPYLQTVGVAGLGEGRVRVLEALARLGVSRITELEGIPWPRPGWHHDGSGPLQDLVRWTDIEGADSASPGIAEE